MIQRKTAGKVNILVVDDERVVGAAVKEELKDAGYTTVRVTISAKEAIREIKRRPYALAFVDLWMPGLDGVQTCREIKKYSPKTEVVLISGRPDGFGGREGEFVKAGGLDFFLYKPFLENELLETVRKVLKVKKR